VLLPRRLADTTVALLTLIRRHQRIPDYGLHTAAAIEKLPGNAELVWTSQETPRPPVALYAEWIARIDTQSESDRRAKRPRSSRRCGPRWRMLPPPTRGSDVMELQQ
jgi:hypothetical protein